MLALETGAVGAVLDSWTARDGGFEYRRTVIDDLTGETTDFPAEQMSAESARIAQESRLAIGFRWV
jgi:hypothetical protein